MLLRKEKGWDTRPCNVCPSNQHTKNDLYQQHQVFTPLDFFKVKVNFTFCLLKRCILVPLLASYISISFAIAEIRNLFLRNEILAYLLHESGS